MNGFQTNSMPPSTTTIASHSTTCTNPHPHRHALPLIDYVIMILLPDQWCSPLSFPGQPYQPSLQASYWTAIISNANGFETIHLLFIRNSTTLLLATQSLVSFDLFLSSIVSQSSCPSNAFSLYQNVFTPTPSMFHFVH